MISRINVNFFRPAFGVVEKEPSELFNPDGTVKGYRFHEGKRFSHQTKTLGYDAKGQVESIDMDEVLVDDGKSKLSYIKVTRTPDEFANESKWTTDENGDTIVEFRDGRYNYRGKVNPLLGLVNVVKLGKATPPKTEMSPEKAKILANAGFTEEVIGDLKLKSPYGPELIDDLLDMVVYLEEKTAKGIPVTKDLMEEAFSKLPKGQSGGSIHTILLILDEVWNKRDLLEKVYDNNE